MAGSRRRGGRAGGLTRAVVRLMLLVSVGFGAGFVIGLVSEEPELLVGHLQGRSESIPAEALAAPVVAAEEGLPAVAAAPGSEGDRADDREEAGARTGGGTGAAAAVDDPGPRPGGEPVVAKTRPAAADEDRAPPRVAAAPPPAAPAASPVSADRPMRATPTAPQWAIQVGAFAEQGAARRLADDLARKGYPVEAIPSSGSTRRWRVRVQPVAGEQRARDLADRLKREERLPTWVLRVEARPGS